jgi:hypothetical protein
VVSTQTQSRFPFATTFIDLCCSCAELVLISRSGCALTPEIGFTAGFLLHFLLQKSTIAGGSVFSASKSRPSYSSWILWYRGFLTATVFLNWFQFRFPVLGAGQCRQGRVAPIAVSCFVLLAGVGQRQERAEGLGSRSSARFRCQVRFLLVTFGSSRSRRCSAIFCSAPATVLGLPIRFLLRCAAIWLLEVKHGIILKLSDKKFEDSSFQSFSRGGFSNASVSYLVKWLREHKLNFGLIFVVSFARVLASIDLCFRCDH